MKIEPKFENFSGLGGRSRDQYVYLFFLYNESRLEQCDQIGQQVLKKFLATRFLKKSPIFVTFLSDLKNAFFKESITALASFRALLEKLGNCLFLHLVTLRMNHFRVQVSSIFQV